MLMCEVLNYLSLLLIALVIIVLILFLGAGIYQVVKSMMGKG